MKMRSMWIASVTVLALVANADITTDPKAWHTLKVTHVGNKITVAFDGKTLIEKEDATFPAAGMIGLWTKADAAAAFDDLKVEPKVATGEK